MNVDLDSSRKFQDKVLLISGLLTLALPLLLALFFTIGEENFVYSKKFYAIVVDEGNESATRLNAIRSPLTDSENVKSWLSVGMIDIFSTDSLNYKSANRWKTVKNYFDGSLSRSFWDAEINRYEGLLSETYELSYAVVSVPPTMIGSAVSSSGTRMWKYYLEVTTENHSRNSSRPSYKKLKMIVVVKEINPKNNYKGVAITSIEIK